MSLRKKTILGVLWNALELISGKAIQLLITIILARFLLPKDFGVVALLVIFTELSKVLLDSGFSQALIRKKETLQEDFTAVFYFNIAVGFFIYIILYFLSPMISDFYNLPELTTIARLIFLTILINSFGIVLNAIIIKKMNFKILAKRTIISNLLAGIIAIYLAYKGYGVWSLVVQILIGSILHVVLLWISSGWLPSLSFSFKSIQELLPFSSNLLFMGIIDVLVSNIQMLLIGKYYTSVDLGYYYQAKVLSTIPSQTLTSIIKNVTYPVLAEINNDLIKLKNNYRKIINITLFVIFPLMFILIAIGKNLILFMLGVQWLPAVKYFILLSFVGAIYPLYSINQNIFLAQGNSKLLFKISIVQKIIALIGIFVTIHISILALVFGYVITTIINTMIIMYYAGREINYSLREQIEDIIGIILITIIMFIVIYYLGINLYFDNLIFIMLIQIIIGIFLYFILSYIFKLKALDELKLIILKRRG